MELIDSSLMLPEKYTAHIVVLFVNMRTYIRTGRNIQMKRTLDK